MNTKSIIVATTIALGFGAFALPATAQDDYGQRIYTVEEPTRFAPAGRLSLQVSAVRGADTSTQRQRLYDRIDANQRQW